MNSQTTTDAKEAAYKRSETARFVDLFNALLTDSRRVICTPGWVSHGVPGIGRPEAHAFDVVLDHFAGTTGEEDLIALLDILKDAAHSNDGTLSYKAKSWVLGVATKFAEFHASDEVEE